MSARILVTYASRTGSTEDVAQAIGDVLAEEGAEVDVRPMVEVSDLSPYSAVVAGSAIRGGTRVLAARRPPRLEAIRAWARALAPKLCVGQA